MYGDDFSLLIAQHDKLLTLSAFFEGDFFIDWIVKLTNFRISDVLSELEKLRKSGWLKEREPGIYCFQEKRKRIEIIKILSKEKQISYHEQIYRIILAEQIDENRKARILSHHLLQISNNLDGCLWLKKAGDFSIKNFEYNHALKCYLKIFDDLSHLKNTQADELFIQVALQYAKISIAQQETSKELSILYDAVKRASIIKDIRQQALLQLNIAIKESLIADGGDTAIRHFKEARRLAEIPNNDYALDRINRYENYFYYWQGRYDKVIECYEKYTSEIMKFPEGIFPLLSISITGYAYAQTGLFSQAVGMLDALCKHTRKIGDQYVEASAILALGSAFLDIGKVEEAVEYLNSGLALAVKDKNSWVEMAISLPLSYCFYMAGDIPRSITHFRKYEDLSKRTQITLFPQPYLLEICLLFEKNDDLPNGTAFSLKKEIHKVLSAKNVFLQGIATRCQALMERNKTGDHSQIVKLLNRSIELLRKSGSKIEIAKTQLELARQYLYSGKDKLASKTLSSASKVLSPLNEALIPDDLKHLSAGHYYGENSLKEIFKLGKKIVDIRKSKELGSQLLVSVNRITGAERGALFLQKNSQLELKSSQNITSDQIFGPQFATSLILIKEVVQSGKACIKKQKIKKRTSTFMSEEARSIICVPLILRGQVMGVLYHDSRIFDRTFTESDFELLDYFAGLAAIALDNVLSYEEIQIEKQKLEEKNKYLEEELFMNITSSNDIIGESIPIKQILQRIHQVARTDANALILGATGTGKELVAKAIHQNSLRKEKPFICVQCSALPEQLLASEMFGHEKGAFTGASKRRIGRFELADGGTIFLDEIGDLQPETQVQLLRVLETKKFERIGGNQTIHSDFRLIAATNRDLEEEARKGRFRMDLYYRLNVFPIIIPELRERKEDIPLLTDYFIKLYSKKHGKKFDDIPPGEMKKVMDYDWPGNVRELEHTIERAIILGTGPCLNISILITLSKDPRNFPDQQLTLLDNERQHILNALLKTNWKVRGKGGAAELLDINSSTLFFRMKKLGIKRPDSIRLL